MDSKPGQGTSFKIYLPACMGDQKTPDKISEVEVEEVMLKEGNETILLVEDETAILEMITEMIESQGYTVFAASRPEHAIRIAEKRESEIDLLITDVILPEMNGQDLAQKIRSFCPELKCLFMSGYTADVIGQHGVLDEEVAFIQKPFHTKSLLSKIREILDEDDDWKGETNPACKEYSW